jgi:hypothetical protein
MAKCTGLLILSVGYMVAMTSSIRLIKAIEAYNLDSVVGMSGMNILVCCTCS